MPASDATPFPVRGQAFRVTFPILDADGDLVTAAATLDSEVSKDAGTFTACTNEATEIATGSGMYYLDLTATEMTADTVAVIVKTGTAGAKTTPIVLYPQQDGLDRKVDVTHIAGAAVSTSSAQLGVNVVNAAGTAWGSGAITAASVAASALNGKGDWALASVLGALATSAGTGDPNTSKTIMAYAKQLVNVLIGTNGIATFPAEAAPANAVSLAEVIRAIHADVTGLNGAAMRGTDNALLAASAPANFGALDITAATGRVTTGTNLDKTGYSISGTKTTLDALNDVSAATVNAEVDAALNTAIPGTPTADSINERLVALDDNFTVARAGYLDELNAPNLPADIDQLKADLPNRITKNVAFSNFPFLMVDSTDHVTPKTGLTITATRRIDGGAFAACANAATEVANGIYTINLAASDVNGDVITFRFTAATADDRFITVLTQPT